jgi:hypothetical protein
MEECAIDAAALPLITTIVVTTRQPRVLRVRPISAAPEFCAPLFEALPQNRTLVELSVNDAGEAIARRTLARNQAVSEITAEVLQGYVPRSSSTKTQAIKAIKPGVKEPIAEMPAYLGFVPHGMEGRVRFGMSETIGRCSEMCGTSMPVDDTPMARGTLFGVFDSHDGRDAVEYASANLPTEITGQIASGKSVAGLRRLRQCMERWQRAGRLVGRRRLWRLFTNIN